MIHLELHSPESFLHYFPSRRKKKSWKTWTFTYQATNPSLSPDLPFQGMSGCWNWQQQLPSNSVRSLHFFHQQDTSLFFFSHRRLTRSQIAQYNLTRGAPCLQCNIAPAARPVWCWDLLPLLLSKFNAKNLPHVTHHVVQKKEQTITGSKDFKSCL